MPLKKAARTEAAAPNSGERGIQTSAKEVCDATCDSNGTESSLERRFDGLDINDRITVGEEKQPICSDSGGCIQSQSMGTAAERQDDIEGDSAMD